MKKCWILSLVIVLICAQASAANWYVRPSGGSGAGTSWTAAWNGLNSIVWSSVACGDTIWIAGGTYSAGLSINKNCSSGTAILVRRVLSTDSVPTAAAGWQSSFDSTVTINANTAVRYSGVTSYVTVDGRISSSGNGVASGIVLNMSGAGSAFEMSSNNPGYNLDHITLTHIDVHGPSCVATGCSLNGSCSGNVNGLNLAPVTASVTNMLVDNVSIDRTGEQIRANNWSNNTIQYSTISNTGSDGPSHPDVMYTYESNTNLTWRYNRIYGSPCDGILWESGNGASNWKFYGNVYYNSQGSLIDFKAGTRGPFYMYNNTFYNTSSNCGNVGYMYFQGTFLSGSESANNLWYCVGSSRLSGGTNDYNAYNYSFSGETGSYQFSGDPFVNAAAGDFHLSAAGATILNQRGKPLTADPSYALDPDGHPRSTWYMGAYEYGTSERPAPPSNLQATVQ